ncbi:unnamed protein product [Nesidiocoris tenuis]|uniref:protein xylosyltransferase n=1 Tax=Nesidiocoris tenuis TaxID=355587 RepID=A0A6H5GCR2_9HEMI|nr:unnamed protein product [Nesidiocoris tenuis]
MTRVLKDHYVQLKTTNSPLYCINICIQGGYPYAGVEFGSECFCGSNEPSSSTKLPDSSCNMKCPADPKQACGGFYAVNIYQTGVARMTKEPVVETWMKKGDTQLRNKDAQVRIVFLLTLNGRAVRQVKRLIKALYHSSHFFYIHVDARQDYMMRELLQLELRHSNVRLSRRRHATIWGGASLLTMLLEAMADLVQSGWQWDFVINLSESDYPVKTNDQLVDFLTANRDRNFVKSHGHEVQRFIQKQGLDKTFVECDAHMWRIGDRTLPDGIVIDGGSDWLALSRSFVEYLASGGSETLVQGLTTVFKHTLLPAESFFHTVLRNSMFCESYVNNNLHVTNWKRKLGCKCQYKHIVDWCGCSPNDFRIDDWQRVVATEAKPVFFARKFEPIVDQGIVNQLDAWLYGAHPPDLPGLNSYWQSIYSVHDLGPSSDDALISLGLSLARAAFKNTSSNNCSLTSTRLVEITSYHKLDYYQYYTFFTPNRESRKCYVLLIGPNHILKNQRNIMFHEHCNVLCRFLQARWTTVRGFLSSYQPPLFQQLDRLTGTSEITFKLLLFFILISKTVFFSGAWFASRFKSTVDLVRILHTRRIMDDPVFLSGREEHRPILRRSQRAKKTVNWGGILSPSKKRVKTEPAVFENVPSAKELEEAKNVAEIDPTSALEPDNPNDQEILLSLEEQEVFADLDMAVMNKNPFLITSDFQEIDGEALEAAEVLSESTLSADETAHYAHLPGPTESGSRTTFLDHSYALNTQNFLDRFDANEKTRKKRKSRPTPQEVPRRKEDVHCTCVLCMPLPMGRTKIVSTIVAPPARKPVAAAKKSVGPVTKSTKQDLSTAKGNS